MTDSAYVFTKTTVDLPSLTLQIQAAPLLLVALDYCTTYGTQLTVYMKAPLPDDATAVASVTCQTAALQAVIDAHTGIPLVEPQSPRDSDGSLIIRPKTTKTGWHFEPRSMDFFTGQYKSLYNRKYNNATILGGTDIGDGVLKFYDNTGALLVPNTDEADADYQTRLTANCVMTLCDWEPTYAFDLVGGYFQVVTPPDVTSPCYLWIVIAPDVPEMYGGSVPFCNGGWNLAFFPSRGDPFDVDGKGVKSFIYDPVYHSGKIRMIIKHYPGTVTGIQIIYKQYKA